MNAPLPPPTKPTLIGLFDIDCCALLVRLHFHPLALFRREFNRFQHLLIPEAIFEGWLNRFALHASVDEVGNRVDEGMLVAQQMSITPPLCDVRMRSIRLRYQN